jgi:hypothetical protein
VRGAIRTLETVGFLDRSSLGRRYQRTATGLQRQPIIFVFGAAVRSAFEAANRRALQRAQKAMERNRRQLGFAPLATVQGRSTAPLPPSAKPPKDKGEAENVLMGRLSHRSTPLEPNCSLDEALERLRRAIEGKN